MNQRYARTRNEAAAPPLPDRIVRSIADAPYAGLVVRAEADRLQVLPEIASLHTRQELLSIDGVGPAHACAGASALPRVTFKAF